MANKYGLGIQVVVGGSALPEHEKDGRIYVASPHSCDYSLRILAPRQPLPINSPAYPRYEAVISVDGLSVMTGKDASSGERGYIVKGGEDILGFRLNDQEVASFHFGDRKDSYAARIGKPSNVGVIAVKFFSEYKEPDYLELAAHSKGMEECAPGGGFLGGGDLRAKGHDMGTEFGDRRRMEVGRTTFTRNQEVCTVVIEYASEASLRQRGIIVSSSLGDVNPFPGDSGCTPPPGWNGGRR